MADRPATELRDEEMTPEMIEAGVREFRDFNHDFDDEREAVIRIWMAMRDVAINNPV
jgi:hypothetical protein